MPRSLRWYIWLCKYKLYIYATAGVIILLSAFCLGMGVYSYKIYIEQVAKYEQIQMDEQSKQIRNQYHAMEDTMSQLLQHGAQLDNQYCLVTLLDGAMSTRGTITLRHIEFSDGGFTVDGNATNDEAYHSYVQYVQAHMKQVICDGKQQVEKADGSCSFHLDGHTKQHDTKPKEDIPSV